MGIRLNGQQYVSFPLLSPPSFSPYRLLFRPLFYQLLLRSLSRNVSFSFFLSASSSLSSHPPCHFIILSFSPSSLHSLIQPPLHFFPPSPIFFFQFLIYHSLIQSLFHSPRYRSPLRAISNPLQPRHYHPPLRSLVRHCVLRFTIFPFGSPCVYHRHSPVVLIPCHSFSSSAFFFTGVSSRFVPSFTLLFSLGLFHFCFLFAIRHFRSVFYLYFFP